MTGVGSPQEGAEHLRLRRGTGYVDRSVDLSGRSNVTLQFWAKADSFEAGETALVLVSPDGVDWTVLKTWSDGEDDNTYRFYQFDLSSFPMTSQFWVAFDAEMSAANDRFYVDDLTFTGQ